MEYLGTLFQIGVHSSHLRFGGLSVQLWVPLLVSLSLSLSRSIMGMSPFMAMFGYQPLLFPEQERELPIPSVQENISRCRQVWREARASLVRTAAQNQRLADRRLIPAPAYAPGQEVWLSSRDLSLY